MITGFATAEGTARYRDRFPELNRAGHFHRPAGVPGASELWLSSLGLGTYLGETDGSADAAYTEAIMQSLRSGINVLDTAINYRHQRSERNIGNALEQVITGGMLQRDEVLVCTKAGYLCFDGDAPNDPRGYFIDEYINKGIMRPTEIAGGMHCMAPAYLENQLERSRTNLKLETIDVFYLHNPESQLGAGVSATDFRHRLREAFAALEKAVKAGKIRFYGCATWNAFRLPNTQREAMSLQEVVAVAREVAGDGHRFRFVQLPFNLAMPEAFALKNQISGNEILSFFEIAEKAGVAVIGSATLYQGRLTQGLPEAIRQKLGTTSDTESAIQFARSAPGIATALIGMGHKEHVATNLVVASQPLVPREQWESLFQQVG
jgi:aryl-alcohol dehydrogenase-like predicted oxidoreductase